MMLLGVPLPRERRGRSVGRYAQPESTQTTWPYPRYLNAIMYFIELEVKHGIEHYFEPTAPMRHYASAATGRLSLGPIVHSQKAPG
jgi:hypothetical protein